MPVDREELEAAARSLRVVLFGEGSSDLGFVGVGLSDIHVYVHTGRKAWAGKYVAAWEGEDGNALVSLKWAMDEIDVLSNRLCGFAYPQGMGMLDRPEQLDRYVTAVKARSL